MFKKSGKICMTALAVLTLNAGNQAFAACTDLIVEKNIGVESELSDSRPKMNVENVEFTGFSIMVYGAVAASSGVVSWGGTAIAVGALSSTTAHYSDIEEVYMTSAADSLNPSQDFAYKIMGNSTNDLNNINPDLASFIKNVKREMGKDRSAVIPTDDEIIRAIETVNFDLSACMDEEGEFYMPEKSDLVKTVVDYLNY